MARPRFPGRPGCRYERISVRYGEEEFRTQIDPNLGLVRSFYCGLKLFRELVGESDEDEEFEGFTLQDVRASTKKYTAMLSNFRNEQDSPETSNNSNSIPLAGCHGHGASKTRRQRLRKKMASAVSCIKKGLNNKSCFHSSRTVQSVYTATEKVATAKLKNIKIRLEPDGKQAKIVRGRGRPSLYVHNVKEKKLAKLSVDNSKNICNSSQKQNVSAVCKTVASGHKLSVIPHSKSKRLGKQLAKQLLLKARKGHDTTFSKDGHVDVTAAPGYHRKRFILPTKSSRSSRVIKPNKRFLEDDGYQIMFSKSHKVDSHSAATWFSDNSGPAAETHLLPLEVDNHKWKDSCESSQKFTPPSTTDCSIVLNPTTRRKSNQVQKHIQLISGTSALYAKNSTKKTWRKNSLKNLAVSSSISEVKTVAKTITSSNLHLEKDVGRFGKEKNSKGFMPFHYASTDETALLTPSEYLNSDLSKKTCRRGSSSKMDSLPLAPTYSQLGLHSESTEPKSGECKSGMLHLPLNETSLTGPALSDHEINVEYPSVRITEVLSSGLELRGLNTPGEKSYTSTESGKIGLYDMPLIVEGKRQRKPSLRMRLKQSEEIFGSRESKRLDSRKIIEGDEEETKRILDSDNFSQDDNDERNNSFGNETSEMENKPSLPPIEQSLPTLPTSPFCPKLELFSPTGCGGSFVSPNEKQKIFEPVEKDVDATRRSGNNILRKAKFQLNWAALNRSKAALARSLRAKMRQEARLEKKKLRAQEQKLKQTSVTSPLALSSLSVLSRGLTDVHGSPKQIVLKMEGSATNPVLSPGGSTVPFENIALASVSQDDYDGSLLSMKEGALKRSRKMCAVCGDKIGVFPFWGVPCCTGCRKFYTLNLKRRKHSHSCKKSGNCSITRFNKTQCSACRLRRCREIFPCDLEAINLASSEKQSSDNDLIFSPAKKSSLSVKKGEPISTTVSSEEQDFVQLTSPKNKQNRRSRRSKDISDEKCLKDESILSEDNACIPSESSSTLNDSSICRTTAGNSKGTNTKTGNVLQQRRRRKVRCKQCEGCLADDCGVCVYCLDKPKYGGKNVIKQACINRRCKFPRYTKFATNSFITPKKESSENKVDLDAQCNISNSQRCQRRGAGSSGSGNGGGGGQLDSGTSPGYQPKLGKPNVKLKRQFLFQQLKRRTKEKAVTLYGKSTDSVNMCVQAPPMFSGAAGYLSSKNLEHIAMRKWTSQDYMYSPTAYRIKVDYKDDCDLCRVWEQGLAILVSTPLCVRTMCYLCGSAGQHEFVYCQLCCEPFHMFCLEEDWRPTDKNIDNWCCYRCHYCQVCGQQNNLLQCNKCHDTYHPECLGPNYPTKPSKKKKIWICTKCVRCKSCGATTPGNSGNATWMHDFSLCYECGKLMDKGNYCPICRKCYTDDDWDSKMVQCSSCDSWVHSKCAGLTDELYMMFSHLPEDVQYICSLCSEKSPAQWECIIQETMQHGFQRVMHALQNSKCAQHLLGPMAAKQGMERLKKKTKPKNCKVNTCGDDDHDSSQDDSTATSLSLCLPHCKSDPSPCHNAPVFKVPHTSPRSKNSSAVNTKTIVGSPNTPSVFSSVSGCDKLIKSEAVTTYSSTNKVATSISSSQICDSSQTHYSDKLNNSICSYSTSRKCLLESFNKNSEIISNVTSSPNNSSFQTNSSKDSEMKAIDISVPKTTAVSLPKTGGACRFVMGPMPPAGFFRRNISNRSHGISITSTSKVPTTTVSCHNTLSIKSSSIANTLTQSPPNINNLNPSSESCSISMFPSKVISYGNSPKIPSVSTVCSNSSVNTVSALNGTIMTPNIVSCFSDTKAQSPHGSIVSSIPTCSFNNLNNSAPCNVDPKTTSSTDVLLSHPQIRETANNVTQICTNTTTSCTVSSAVGIPSNSSITVSSTVSYGSSFISTVSSTATNSGLATSTFPDTVSSNNNTSTTTSITPCISSIIKSSDTITTSKSSPSAVTTVINQSSVFPSPACSLNTHKDANNFKKTDSSDRLFKNVCSSNQKDKSTPETSKLNTIIEEDEEIETNNNASLATPVSTTHLSSLSSKTPSTNSFSTSSQTSLKSTKCPSPTLSEDSTTDSASEDSDDVSKFNYKDVATCLQKERQKLFSEARKSKSLYTSDDGNLKCIPELALKAEKVKEYPKNFHCVIEKINKLHYQSVHQFNEDMVWIIQTALNDSADQTVSRKRANNSVRSIFIKQMEKYFPWFNVKACALWDHNKILPVDMLPNAVLPPSGDHTYAQWMARAFQPSSSHDFPLRKTCTTPHKKPGSFSLSASHSNKDNESDESSTAVEVCEDFRTCVLCWKTSDLDPEEEGRLVYVGQDDWIHVNCALWSAEAFEEESDGTLQNVQPAISRGKMMRCDKCTRPGATVGCCHRGCPANFHFLCAKQEYCIFQEDKKVFCYNHRHKVDGDLVEDNDFDVIRRVCIYMDHQKYPKKSWVKGLPASGINVVIGSCTVECLGNLTPLSDRFDMLLPVGFRSTRVYWSTKHANKRCVYTCRISLVKPHCPKKLNKEQQKLQSAEHNTTKIEDPVLLENSKIKEIGKSKTLTAESAEDCGRLGGLTNDDDESVVKASEGASLATSNEKDLVSESNEQSNISSAKSSDPKDSTNLELKDTSTADSQVAVVEDLEDNIMLSNEENKLFEDVAQDMETVVVVAEAEDMTDEEAIQLAREALLAADSNLVTENEISTELIDSDKGELDSMKFPKFDTGLEPEIVECSFEQPIVIPSCADEDLPDNINSSLDAISEVQIHSECDKEMMYFEDDNKPVQVISFNRKTLPLNKKPQNRYSKIGSRFEDDKSTRFSPIYGPKGDIIGHKLSITDALALKNSLPTNSQNNLKDHSKRRLKKFCSKKNVKLLELDKSKHRKMVSSELTNSLHVDKSRISGNYTGVSNFNTGNLDKVSCNKGVQEFASSSEPSWLNDTFDLGKISGKSKNSPPVKVYPLRQTVSRMCEQALAKRPLEAISRSCRDDRAKSSLSVLSTVETTPEELVVVKRSEDIPLHDKIALKIRAESLAKSSPGERGPFKCPTCKRLYRTKESFETHVEKCDFELSTSEEEEDDQDGLRSPRRYLGNPRYPMRNSTLIQRVAAEVEAEMNYGKKIHSRKRFHDSMSGLDLEGFDSIQNKIKQSRSRKPEDATTMPTNYSGLCGQIGNEQAQLVENLEVQHIFGSSSEDFESKDLDSSNENSISQTNLSIKEDKLTRSNCLPESFADDSDATLSPAQCDLTADHSLSLIEEDCDKQNASVSPESVVSVQSTTDRNNLDLLSELASKLSKPPNQGNCRESDSTSVNYRDLNDPKCSSDVSLAKKLKIEEDSGRIGKLKFESINGIIGEASFLKQSVSRDRDSSIPSEILPSCNSSESVKQHNTAIADDKTQSSLGELFIGKCKELEDSKHRGLFYQIFHNISPSNSTSKSLLNVIDPLTSKSKMLSKITLSEETQTDNNPHQEIFTKNKPIFNNSITKSPIEFSTNPVKNINSFGNISHINNPAISLVSTSSSASLTSLTPSLSSNVTSSHISDLNNSSTQLIQCQDSMAPRMLTTPVVTMALCNTVCTVQPQTTCVVAPAQSVQPLTMSMQSASSHLLSLTSVNTPYFNTSNLSSPALPTLASPIFSQAAVTPIAIAPPLPSQQLPTPTLSINYVGSFVLPSTTDQLVNITPPLSSNPFSSIATSVPQLQSIANINTSESITKIQSATTMHHAPNTMMLQEGLMQNKPPYIIHKTSVPTMQNSSSVVKILVDNPPTSFVTGSSIDSNSSNTAYNYSKLLQEIFKVRQPPTITNQTSLITSTVSSKPDSCQTTSTSLVENPMASASLSSLSSSNHKRSPSRKLYSRISSVKTSGLKAPFVFRQNCNTNQLADSATDPVKLLSGVEESSKFIQNMVSLSSNSDLQVVSNKVNRSVVPSQKEQFNLVSRKRPSAVGLQSTKRILSFISNKNGIVSDQQKEKEESVVALDSINNTEGKATEDAGNQTLTPATDFPNQTSDATDSKVFDPFTPKVTLRKKPVRKTRNLNFRRRPRDLRKKTCREGNQLNGDAPFAEVEEEVMETPFMSSQSRNSTGPSIQPKPDLNLPHLVFEISSDDGFYCRAHSIDDAWCQVYEAVQDVRALSKRKQLSYANIDGALMFGVSHRAVVYLLEQLHGAKKCYNYKFNYHSPPREYDEDDQEPTETSSGCIRTEPFSTRKPYDMFSFLMSRYRNRPQSNHATGDEEMALKSSRRPTSMDLPMAMRFRHLQAHAREAVGVYRSMIHGRGLFCKRNIDAGEMVIEYAGEVIRAELTDKREKFYESKGIGCYMFRIDDVEVVDATMHGNAARFINHSCDPNCYSKVIQVDGKKHIVIFAMRPIKRGEELTYDYKFPIEDIKIACTCGSRRCRKYLN